MIGRDFSLVRMVVLIIFMGKETVPAEMLQVLVMRLALQFKGSTWPMNVIVIWSMGSLAASRVRV